MKQHRSLAALALAATLCLTGCVSSEPGSTPTAPKVEPVKTQRPTSTPSPTASRSIRGNLVKVPGQPSGRYDPDTKKQLVNFVVNSISPV
jgi:curli biogenesis system outer membrane secretion channel CsgG